jgi:hypothetical protein
VDGEDAAMREGNNTQINNAIKQLTLDVVRLESLLAEIQGQPNPPEGMSSEGTKEAVPSIMETLGGTSGRLYKLSERINITINTIRESLF